LRTSVFVIFRKRAWAAFVSLGGGGSGQHSGAK